MPTYHKFRCLNPACGEIFNAWNNNAKCKKCNSIKVVDAEDRTKPYSFGNPGAGKRIDSTLNALAETHGLTDISNKDGKAVKHRSAPEPTFGYKNVMGYNVPIDGTCTTSSFQSSAKVGATPTVKIGNANVMSKVSARTLVKAKHEGKLPL
jgi:hypothetical protein